jgi:hypothetical protein
MATERKYDLEDLLIRPGTYFNPQTEVLVVVDDSPDLDNEIFNMEPFEGADWVLITDEVPIDESKRDEQLEEFQAKYQGGDGRGKGMLDDGDDPVDGDDDDDDEDDDDDDVDPALGEDEDESDLDEL